MKRQTLRHPKLLDLASRLRASRPEALGYLTLLWDFTIDNATPGDVGKWSNGSIARGCDWTSDPDEFVSALVASGWLDEHPTHRLIVHDWPQHCERYVKSKLATEGRQFLPCYFESSPDASRDTSRDGPEDASADPPRDQTFPNLSKPFPSKPNRKRGARAAGKERVEEMEIPAALNQPPFIETWANWIAYRSKIHKPLRPESIPGTFRRLVPLGPAAAAELIQFTIDQGYQGIVYDRVKPGATVGPGQRHQPHLPGVGDGAVPGRYQGAG